MTSIDGSTNELTIDGSLPGDLDSPASRTQRGPADVDAIQSAAAPANDPPPARQSVSANPCRTRKDGPHTARAHPRDGGT